MSSFNWSGTSKERSAEEKLELQQSMAFGYNSLDCSYEELPGRTLERTFNQAGDYAFATRGAFFQLHKMGSDENQRTGAKMHISVRFSDKKEAWDAVWHEVVNSGIDDAKIATPPTAYDFCYDPEEKQAGKIITIYDNGKTAEEWQGIAERLEKAFADKGIEPGPPVQGDKPIAGSRFMFHRHSGVPQGHHAMDVTAAHARELNPENPHNPFNLDSPFDKINVSAVHQDATLNRVRKFTANNKDACIKSFDAPSSGMDLKLSALEQNKQNTPQVDATSPTSSLFTAMPATPGDQQGSSLFTPTASKSETKHTNIPGFTPFGSNSTHTGQQHTVIKVKTIPAPSPPSFRTKI